MATDTIPCHACEGRGWNEVEGYNFAKDADEPKFEREKCSHCCGEGEWDACWDEDQAAYVDSLEDKIAGLEWALARAKGEVK